MSNLYKIMVDIKFICRLSQAVEKIMVQRSTQQEYVINVLSNDTVYRLKKEIFKEVNQRNDNRFSDIKANNLDLWMVKNGIDSEDEFLNLVLDEENDGVKLLEEYISECWDEENLPEKRLIHVIVDSPRLIERYEKDEDIARLTDSINSLTMQDGNDYSYPIPDRWSKWDKPGKKLRDLCSAKIIRENDELRIKKKYGHTPVEIRCRVTNVDHGKLSIIHIGSTGPDWDKHREIISHDEGNKGINFAEILSPFDLYTDAEVESIFGGSIKIEGISELPDLEKSLVNICEIPEKDIPEKFHSEESIKIARGENVISIKRAIDNYRDMWKKLHDKKKSGINKK